ncbi:hypothetical protein MO973_18230 [Paenibacillus sp. TRM 82003]|nr:hypothetical protein [Paenibacillus sp. TRM 82003]
MAKDKEKTNKTISIDALLDTGADAAISNATNAVNHALTHVRVINLEQAITNYKATIEQSVRTNSGQLSNLPDDKLKGFVFEAHHKASYNIDAAAKGHFPHRTQAKIGGEPLADGSLMSTRDQLNDIILETRHGLRQRLGLDHPTQKGYQAKAYKDEGATQRALKGYDTGKVGPSDHVPDHSVVRNEKLKVQSDAMDSITLKQSTTKAREGKIEYDRAGEKVRELKLNNFKYAVGSAAVVAGLQAAIVEIYDIVKNKKELTLEQFQTSVVHVLKGAADGGARAGVIYCASSLFRTSVPVLAAANTLYDFAKDMYKFCDGTIDADDLLCNTVNNAFSSAAAFGGAQLGVAAAVSLGATIGTAVGPVGTAVGAAIGGLVFGLGAGAVISSASKEAAARVRESLEDAMQATTQYPEMRQLRLIDSMSRLSERPFTLKSLIPMHNIIGDLSEYRQRKQVLTGMMRDIEHARNELDARFHEAERAIYEQHRQRLAMLEDQFQQARTNLAGAYRDQFDVAIGGEFREFQLSFAFSFGNLSLRWGELEQQQQRHERKLDDMRQRREANAFLIELLEAMKDGENVSSFSRLFGSLRARIREDAWLKELDYINREDIRLHLREGIMPV